MINPVMNYLLESEVQHHNKAWQHQLTFLFGRLDWHHDMSLIGLMNGVYSKWVMLIILQYVEVITEQYESVAPL